MGKQVIFFAVHEDLVTVAEWLVAFGVVVQERFSARSRGARLVDPRTLVEPDGSTYALLANEADASRVVRRLTVAEDFGVDWRASPVVEYSLPSWRHGGLQAGRFYLATPRRVTNDSAPALFRRLGARVRKWVSAAEDASRHIGPTAEGAARGGTIVLKTGVSRISLPSPSK